MTKTKDCLQYALALPRDMGTAPQVEFWTGTAELDEELEEDWLAAGCGSRGLGWYLDSWL